MISVIVGPEVLGKDPRIFSSSLARLHSGGRWDVAITMLCRVVILEVDRAVLPRIELLLEPSALSYHGAHEATAYEISWHLSPPSSFSCPPPP